MTEQEQNLIDLQHHNAIQDARISNLETKFEMFMNSLQDFKNEMRDRDNRRADEISELRGTFQTIQNTLIQMQTSNRNQNVLVIIGVIAIAVAVFLK